MEKKWIYKKLPETSQIHALSKTVNINPSLATLLWQRGVYDFDQAKKYFRPSWDQLHDPFSILDMDAAVERLHQAITRQEKILIYGDYDVDGTTAIALVYLYLKKFYPHCIYYVPDRYTEGYGVSEKSILWANQHGVSLIIALDLGIKAQDSVELASQKNIDFIICDHHVPGTTLPKAVAILNPKRPECSYSYKELTGCGLGFKMIQGYAKRYRTEDEIMDYLDLVCVSTASDIVPITGENRVFAFLGLQKLNRNPNVGLKILKRIAGLRKNMTISDIVFSLAPRINAAGRIGHAKTAVDLLTSTDETMAHQYGMEIEEKNQRRKTYDSTATQEALTMIEKNQNQHKTRSTVLYNSSWNKGVVGIVAARCIEKYYRPTIILTQSNGKITGSARSIRGFDLYQAIHNCVDFLETYGGHKYAAGLTLSKENLNAFSAQFENIAAKHISDDMLIPAIDIDLPIQFDRLSTKYYSIIKQMAPFGPENQKPTFEADHVYVDRSLQCFKGKHISFFAAQEKNNIIFRAIGFNMKSFYDPLSRGEKVRIAFTLEEEEYDGQSRLYLRLKDIKPK